MTMHNEEEFACCKGSDERQKACGEIKGSLARLVGLHRKMLLRRTERSDANLKRGVHRQRLLAHCAFVFLFCTVQAQTQKPCPPEGDAKDAKHQSLNRLKNRSNSVNENYFDPTNSLEV